MERIYLVVFDRRGIGSRRRLEGKHLLPTSPPPEAASSTPNLSLPPLCSGSVASTADSRNVRCRANCSSTPDPAPPLSPRNWLTSLFPTTTTLARHRRSTRGRRISLQPRSTFSSPSFHYSILEFEVALHAC